MHTAQGTVLQSLRAVQTFLDDHADRLAGVVASGARKDLDDLVAQLDVQIGEQSAGSISVKGATQKHRTLRTILMRDHMTPIARIAVASLPNTPEVQPLKMPRGQPSAQRLAAAAHGMAKAATPFADVFVHAGMPADFAAQLTTAADAMMHSVNDRTTIRGKRGGATKGLKSSLSQGRKVVHVIDAFVRTALQDDAGLLAHWNIVKRVKKAPTSVTTPAAAPLPAATPNTATAAAAA
jgi:hypothetical protein